MLKIAPVKKTFVGISEFIYKPLTIHTDNLDELLRIAQPTQSPLFTQFIEVTVRKKPMP